MRRNDLDICADILRVAQKRARKTRIVYSTNLNFKIVKKYLGRLIDNGLLKPADDDRCFITTRKGALFLEQYGDLINTINGGEGLDEVHVRSLLDKNGLMETKHDV